MSVNHDKKNLISLRSSMLRAFISPVFLMAFLISCIVFGIRINDAITNAERNKEDIIVMMSAAAEYGIMTGDKRYLINIINKSLGNRNDIEEIRIYDDRDVILISKVFEDHESYIYNELFKKYYEGIYKSVPDKRDIFVSEVSLDFGVWNGVSKNNIKVGALELKINYYPYIISELESMFLIMLLIFTLAAILSLRANQLGRRLVSPIESLIHGLEDFKNIKKPVFLPNSDIYEIRKLQDWFKLTSDTIISHQLDLESRIQKATKELILSNEELKKKSQQALQASKTKSQFLSNVSHEFKTPLSGVGILCNLIESSMKDGRFWEIQSIVNNIRASQKSLLSLINEILHYSEIENDQVNIFHKPTNVIEMTKRVVSNVGPIADSKNLCIYTIPDIDYADVFYIDERHVERVLSNLVSNAVKYTHDGSVSIFIEFDDDNLIFRVKDTGIGIAKEKLEEVFTPFIQCDLSDTRAYEGTGLGLAISKSLTEIMGGTIKVESVIDIGSEFSFNIPVSQYGRDVCNDCHDEVKDIAVEVISSSKIFQRFIKINLDKAGYINVFEKNTFTPCIDKLKVVITDESTINDSEIHQIHQTNPGIVFIRVCQASDVAALKSPGRIKMLIDEFWSTSFTMKDMDDSIQSILINKKNNKDQCHIVEGLKDSSGSEFEEDYVYEFSKFGEPSDGSLKDIRILLVEDNALLQQIIQTHLARNGAKVDVANNAQEGIQRALVIPYDCILMDYQMPYMSGEDGAIAIQEKVKNAPPIICLTAAHFSKDSYQRISGVFDSIVFKTDDPELMIEKIKEVI